MTWLSVQPSAVRRPSWVTVHVTGVIRAPKWKDGFDNVTQEWRLLGVGFTAGLGARPGMVSRLASPHSAAFGQGTRLIRVRPQFSATPTPISHESGGTASVASGASYCQSPIK